jgi:hypothetical protein
VTASVLAAASEAGSARAIIPVLERLLARGFDVIASFTGAAASVLAAREAPRGLRMVPGEAALRLIGESGRAVVLTGTTIGPGIEKDLTTAAQDRRVPAVAVLDSWCSYRERFELEGEKRGPSFPDLLLVMDGVALEEAAEAGIPKDRLRITGQPAFDVLADRSGNALLRGRRTASPVRRILFLSEPLRAFHRRGLGGGFTELDAFERLDAARHAMGEWARPALVIRPHPLDSSAEWEQRASAAGPDVSVETGRSLLDAFDAVDAVVGISSIALVEAFLYGLPVGVIQAAAHSGDALVLSRRGILPRLSTVEQVRDALITGFPTADEDRAREIRRWADGGAGERAAEEIFNLISAGRDDPR